MPVTTRDTTVRYINPGRPACDVVLPAGTPLARLDDGRTVEYVVADAALLRRLAGASYGTGQPYCFVPEDAADCPALPEEGHAVPVEPSLMASWMQATSGFFDPTGHCLDAFGEVPGAVRAGAGCRASYGPPIPVERRRWEDGDWSLRTGVDGLLLQVRPRSPDHRRFGYAMTPALGHALNAEAAAHRSATGATSVLETWEMPEGSLGRRAAEALARTVEAVGLACGMEMLPTAHSALGVPDAAGSVPVPGMR